MDFDGIFKLRGILFFAELLEDGEILGHSSILTHLLVFTQFILRFAQAFAHFNAVSPPSRQSGNR